MHMPIKLDWGLNYIPFFSESREGTGETVRMHSLVLAFTARICDKNQVLVNWLLKFETSSMSPLHPLLAGLNSINLQRLCIMGVGSFTSKDKPATNIFK